MLCLKFYNIKHKILLFLKWLLQKFNPTKNPDYVVVVLQGEHFFSEAVGPIAKIVAAYCENY